jgi:hypothetical protein
VDVESRNPAGMPDEFVQGLAWRFAELAWVIRQQHFSQAPTREALLPARPLSPSKPFQQSRPLRKAG